MMWPGLWKLRLERRLGGMMNREILFFTPPAYEICNWGTRRAFSLKDSIDTVLALSKQYKIIFKGPQPFRIKCGRAQLICKNPVTEWIPFDGNG